MISVLVSPDLHYGWPALSPVRSRCYDGLVVELSVANAGAYLGSRGFSVLPGAVSELGGGVSNIVLLVESGATRMVLKQALGKLRVEQDWFSDTRRIFRESLALRMLAPHLEAGAVPAVLFEDRDRCLYAMSAAPPAARPWKSLLLEGAVDEATAASVARMLAALARLTWRDPAWESCFGDQAVFDQLRLDPYYRATAARHPDLAPAFARLIEQARTRRVCLVHGDWSPKNFLVADGSVMAIDFEVVHFGDPAFDAAFLLNHLLLKSFYLPAFAPALRAAARGFWREYRAGLPAGASWIESGTLAHLGGLLLARIDGKSPVEYIREPELRERIRVCARELMLHPPARVDEVFAD